MHGFISGFSSVFHWFMCLSLCLLKQVRIEFLSLGMKSSGLNFWLSEGYIFSVLQIKNHVLPGAPCRHLGIKAVTALPFFSTIITFKHLAWSDLQTGWYLKRWFFVYYELPVKSFSKAYCYFLNMYSITAKSLGSGNIDCQGSNSGFSIY